MLEFYTPFPHFYALLPYTGMSGKYFLFYIPQTSTMFSWQSCIIYCFLKPIIAPFFSCLFHAVSMTIPKKAVLWKHCGTVVRTWCEGGGYVETQHFASREEKP
jgi:hypothetical protein